MSSCAVLWKRMSVLWKRISVLWKRMSLLWKRMSLLWKINTDLWMKIAAGQESAVDQPGPPGAGSARRNLSRNVRRGVRRSGSAGNIGRSGVPYLWKLNVDLWKVIAFMESKCIYGK